ncbi:hypothetical protein JDM601_1676 [Mycolicibacter sinensis]|uniref:Uncharacterized protein n=1 Tax=Mycolicibacter sinensis (strain JDM601) TaxID=875328 RepID=F5Z0W1_MYCSD|nr:hypothetical protein JDM601_1676 [Mycolicibacter sinensis]
MPRRHPGAAADRERHHRDREAGQGRTRDPVAAGRRGHDTTCCHARSVGSGHPVAQRVASSRPAADRAGRFGCEEIHSTWWFSSTAAGGTLADVRRPGDPAQGFEDRPDQFEGQRCLSTFTALRAMTSPNRPALLRRPAFIICNS